MTHEETLYVYVHAVVDELARQGATQVVLCPGSRSTPLALLLAEQPDIKLWTLVDERSAAFFALGMAKTGQQPVALVCTSGTAAANFYPAVIEARYGGVPLIVLTADRPPEQRDVGAAQTIDQVRLYGEHVKWFMDMPLPEARPEVLRYARTTVARAVATAQTGPAGPVHLNFPFREPLVPIAPAAGLASFRGDAPYVAVTGGPRSLPAGDVGRIAGWTAAECGLIVCGPDHNPALAPAVTALAATLGWPVLADPLSGVRCGPHTGPLVVDAYDAFLRDPAWAAAHPPAVVLRFGAIPTAKPLLLYLQQYPEARHILVDGDGGWNDPTLLAAEVIHADPVAVCAALGGHGSQATPLSAWTASWLAANRQARAVLTDQLARTDTFFEGKVFAELAAELPKGSTLYVGNSMPVRDLDTFFPATDKRIHILANRGANGIDGVVSSALGAAVANTAGPTVLVIGDLSFYHDLNGLLAAKLYGLRATIIVLNNDGGGIFSFLPQAGATTVERFEQLYGTPTGLDFRPVVEMYGGRFLRPADWPAFRAAVQAGITGEGLTVIEVRTDRAQNVAQHRALWPLVSAAIRDA